MSGMSFQQVQKHPLVDELEKQYEVETIDFNSAVTPGQFHAIVAVQPSSLAPEQFTRFVDAVKAGVPTAIFEDPLPFAQNFIPGTGEPNRLRAACLAAVVPCLKAICARYGMFLNLMCQASQACKARSILLWSGNSTTLIQTSK